MSDTPRTDAKSCNYGEAEFVPSAFARQLERELEQSKQDASINEMMLNQVCVERDAFKKDYLDKLSEYHDVLTKLHKIKRIIEELSL